MSNFKAASVAGLLGLGLMTASTPVKASFLEFDLSGLFGGKHKGGGHGGHGGHGGSSGGAPSPEVNVALGLAMASGTVAFLRRRKKNAAKSDA